MKWDDKVVLLIGGTGSFGTNFLKILLNECKPKTVRIYSRDEHKQSQLLNNYGGVGKAPANLSGLIGDIRDKRRLKMAMYGVDIVIHAAALKQVQSCEYNPSETIKTNILGAMNVVECALYNNVEKVIAISTDKAVNPLNLYGATKMCMEKLFIHANCYRGTDRKTKFCCTRYGNVVASRGTVVPIWRDKLVKKEVLPITNPNATRFWIGMEEANRFVVKCIKYMDFLSGGEIFVPKLPSIKIMDLYRAMTDNLVPFTVIGDRIGDKIHETLISPEEAKHTVDFGDIFIIYPENPQWAYKIPEGDPCVYRNGYTSDSNDWFLDPDDIKKTLEKNPS